MRRWYTIFASHQISGGRLYTQYCVLSHPPYVWEINIYCLRPLGFCFMIRFFFKNMITNLIHYIQIFFVEFLPGAFSHLSEIRFQELISMSPLMLGIFLQIAIIIILILAFKWLKKSKFATLFEYIVEEVYKFFEEILERSGKPFIKNYVVTLFFVILISNLSSWILDRIRMIFVDVEWLSSIVTIPTTSFEFNIWLAVVWIMLMLRIQLKHLWWFKMFLEYVPLGGKWIIDLPRWKMPAIAYYPLWLVIKLFDIWISLFVWLLDIIWIFAKVISLSARLYWNMVSGWILLTMLVVWINAATNGLIWSNFPILAPLILYAQWLLVAVIQAFVFPLLVAIFIKLAMVEEEPQTTD